MKRIIAIPFISVCIVINEKYTCEAFHHSFIQQKVGLRHFYRQHSKYFTTALKDNDLERGYRVLPDLDKPVKKQRKYHTRDKRANERRKSTSSSTETILLYPKYKSLIDIVKEQSNRKIYDIESSVHLEKEKKDSKNEPWAASYVSSVETQKKIRTASTIKANGIDRGIKVLNTTLNTPSEWCNQANVVYTLTLSAKCLSSHKVTSYSQEKREEFRLLLQQILDVVHVLVIEDKFTTRQLANVAWAIAKHYTLDPMILPTRDNNQNFVYLQKDSILSSSEQLHLDRDLNETDKSCEKRVIATVNEVIKRLNDSLSVSLVEHYGSNSKALNIGEISMTCWALSTIYPRSNPAGWKLPSLTGKMRKESESNYVNKSSKNNDTITFEKWESVSDSNQRNNEMSHSIIDDFFDLVAQRLVQHQDDNSPLTRQMSWNELSTIAWSYAHGGFNLIKSSSTLLSQIANEAMLRLEKQNADKGNTPTPRDVSEIAWALGISQTDNHVLTDVLDQYISVISSKYVNVDDNRPLKEWTSADCVQLALALAHGRLDDRILLKHLYNEANYSLSIETTGATTNRQLHSKKFFQSWELSVLLWAQARLSLTKEIGDEFDLFSTYVPKIILARIDCALKQGEKDMSMNTKFASIGLNAQEKANICWSLTVLDKVKSPEAIKLVREIFRDASLTCSRGEEIRLEHAHQLWQSLFLLDFVGDEMVTEEFISFLRLTWDEEKSRSKASSARHKALSQTLDFMGVQHYNEHDEDIDVAIVLKSENKWLHTASKCELTDSQTKVAVE